MDAYIGLFLVVILLAIAIYSLAQEASGWNLISTFLLLCFISYFTIYVIDLDFSTTS